MSFLMQSKSVLAATKARIFLVLVAADKVGLVVAKGIRFQAFYFFAFWSGVTIDYSLVAFIGYLFADVVFVIGNENTFAMAAVFGIQLHGGMEGGSAACEEVEDGDIFSMRIRYF